MFHSFLNELNKIARMKYFHEILTEKVPIFSPDAIQMKCQANRKKRSVIDINRLHNMQSMRILRFKFFKRHQTYLIKEHVQDRIKI